MRLPPIALTMGDPAGIGREIGLKAWSAMRDGDAVFFIIDCPDQLMRWAERFGGRVAEIAAPEGAHAQFRRALPVLRHQLARESVPGHPDPANARAVVRAIEKAVALAMEGRVSAITTNPVNKAHLASGCGFAHSGHTGFLARLAGAPRVAMMLVAKAEKERAGLRVLPLTIHVPLAAAPGLLSEALLVETARLARRALAEDFAIARPRIAVAGLNPHAGEEGLLGNEERAILAPAIARLQAEGTNVFGPLPADSMFHETARKSYDLALCMYHDQALIPLKMLDFFGGVNVTLGLPFIRTSPDHGTAYALAGTGRASPSSLIAAIRLARDIATRRA